MISSKDAANAAGGKTARACDSCVRRRARWFCAADDAFLCQVCDASVHSANTLARRHQRVRLQTALSVRGDGDDPAPSWHRGFTRKARTPRHAKSDCPRPRPAVVPEMGADDAPSISDEHLLCRVPILDKEPEAEAEAESLTGGEMDRLAAFLSPETDLTDFAADVEVLLGKGLEEECCGMEEIGFAGNCHRHEPCMLFGDHNNGGAAAVKVKDEEAAVGGFLAAGEPRRVGFDGEPKREKEILLRLDYEAVMAAWAGQGLPWMSGDRPVLNSEDCWPDCMGGVQCEESGGVGRRHGGAGDGGREARVSRYREKRRTRLFAKKIRYEVRKVNAEKRPRMKGRFVKRASFLGQNAAAPPSLCVPKEGDLHPGLRLRL